MAVTGQVRPCDAVCFGGWVTTEEPSASIFRDMDGRSIFLRDTGTYQRSIFNVPECFDLVG
jgi:hypothetical protein